MVDESTAFLRVEEVLLSPDPTKLWEESRLCLAAVLKVKSSISSSAWFAVIAIVDLRVCFSELEIVL